MAKSLKFGNVILCEHAVRGEGGMSTLVNVYSGDIILTEVPGRVSMGVFIEYTPQEPEPYELFIEFVLNGKRLAKLTAQIEASPSNSIGAITMPIMDLKIMGNSLFEVQAYADGYNKKTIARKKIEYKAQEILFDGNKSDL